MAHLLSPVCTETIKLQSQPPILLTPWRSLPKPSAAIGRGPARRNCSSLKVAARDSASTESVADDYYAVLGLLPDASPEQIKKAYYNCMKECHPDLSGDDQDTTNFCMFINEVYEGRIGNFNIGLWLDYGWTMVLVQLAISTRFSFLLL